jgi:hypothetical protein
MPAIIRTKDTRYIGAEFQTTRGYTFQDAWTAAATASTTRLTTGQATSASATTTVTSFTAQPDYPRNITITPGGTTADVPAGDVVVTGTNIRDEVITENFTFAANASTVTTGNKAFKTVTSIVYPIQDGAAATYDVGIGVKLGLSRKMNADNYINGSVDGTFEATRATVAFSATAIESNTVTFNTAPNASRNHKANYISNELYAGRG